MDDIYNGVAMIWYVAISNNSYVQLLRKPNNYGVRYEIQPDGLDMLNEFKSNPDSMDLVYVSIWSSGASLKGML